MMMPAAVFYGITSCVTLLYVPALWQQKKLKPYAFRFVGIVVADFILHLYRRRLCSE